MKPRLVATSLLTVCGIVQAAAPTEQAALPDQEQAATPKKKEIKANEPMNLKTAVA